MSKVQMPEQPRVVIGGMHTRLGHSDEAMRAYAAAKVAEAVEQCAKALERTGNDHCAAAIRRMKEKAQ